MFKKRIILLYIGFLTLTALGMIYFLYRESTLKSNVGDQWQQFGSLLAESITTFLLFISFSIGSILLYCIGLTIVQENKISIWHLFARIIKCLVFCFITGFFLACVLWLLHLDYNAITLIGLSSILGTTIYTVQNPFQINVKHHQSSE
jgi:hypothetical protein